jgi:hypothetical protein
MLMECAGVCGQFTGWWPKSWLSQSVGLQEGYVGVMNQSNSLIRMFL